MICSAKTSEIDHYGNTHLIVYNFGVVLWIPPATMYVDCDTDFNKWPFDEHECVIYLGSWTSHGWQINLEKFDNKTEVI